MTLYADAEYACLTNTPLMHLFANIKYQLSGQEIESVFNSGQATMMLGLLRYPADFSKSQGLNQLWYKDSGTMVSTTNNVGLGIRHGYLIKSSDSKGTFKFKVPLNHIFGFCENYDKIICRLTQTLTLMRKSDDNAIFRDARVAPGKVALEKMSWSTPHVPSNL